MSPSGIQILIVVLVFAVLFLGPSRIPGLGKSLGQAIRGFKKGLSTDDEVDVTESVQQEKIDGNEQVTQTTSEKEKDKV